MNLMEILLDKLTNYLHGRNLEEPIDGNLYLERYHLLKIPFTQWCIYIHRMFNSDPVKRGLHDHPWSIGFSIILSGWYFEKFIGEIGKMETRKVNWFNWIPGYKIHALIKPKNVIKPIWTIMVRNNAIKRWGFYTPTKKGYNIEYYSGNSDIYWYKKALIGKKLKEENNTTKKEIYK